MLLKTPASSIRSRGSPLEKITLAETQMEELKKVGSAYIPVKMEAPAPILSAATRLYQSLQALTRATTNPFATAAALKAAAEEQDAFIELFRAHLNLGAYTKDDAQRDTESYLDLLKRQTDHYIAEAKRDMHAAGFRSPWDD